MNPTNASQFDAETEVRLFQTALGWIGFLVGPCGIQRIVFDCRSAHETQQQLTAWASRAPSRRKRPTLATPACSSGPDPLAVGKIPDIADRLEQTMIDYAAGSLPDWDDLPLDLAECTPFQARVLTYCRQIPYAATITYRQLAEQSQSPRAARAVGSVMARNPFPLVVPCHRVVGTRGSLHGFSSRGGLDTKKRLLELESASKPATCTV